MVFPLTHVTNGTRRNLKIIVKGKRIDGWFLALHSVVWFYYVERTERVVAFFHFWVLKIDEIFSFAVAVVVLAFLSPFSLSQLVTVKY